MSILITICVILFAVFAIRWLRLGPIQRRFLTLREPIAQAVERQLGGYRQIAFEIEPTPTVELDSPKRVAVIGGGLAGISTATHLAERGFTVKIFEKSPYLGGKLGAWKVNAADGTSWSVEHGFHAFFEQYYNLNAFLEKHAIDRDFRRVQDYVIVSRDHKTYRFGDIETTPILNLISLAFQGVYRFRDILFSPAIHEMDAFLKYDSTETPEKWDHVSLATFAERNRLPHGLVLSFSAFARAFFADAKDMSMAELVKGFHSYYLSNDKGLRYRYPTKAYLDGILPALRSHLDALGVQIALSHPISGLQATPDAIQVDEEAFDYAVLATDVVGTRIILDRSPELQAQAPTLASQVAALRASQRYAVLHLWTDRQVGDDLPVFVSVEKAEVLDSITFNHRIRTEEEGRGIYELHSYSVPDTITTNEEIHQKLLVEFHHYFPKMTDAKVLFEHLEVRQDFPAFHTGMHADRPGVKTENERLYLAGDWVKTPLPCMLMEGAFVSGMMAANHIFSREGLRQNTIYTVPTRGVLADL